MEEIAEYEEKRTMGIMVRRYRRGKRKNIRLEKKKRSLRTATSIHSARSNRGEGKR